MISFKKYPYLQALRFAKNGHLILMEGEMCVGPNNWRPSMGIILNDYSVNHGETDFPCEDIDKRNFQIKLF